MSGLFVNEPRTNSQFGLLTRVRNSKEIKKRRFTEFFYKFNVMELYTWLTFFSVKYNFDSKMLLELLLENLYNESKIDVFVYKMSKMEEKNISCFYCTMLTLILKQYMKTKKVSIELKNSVWNDLYLLMEMNVIMMLYKQRAWKLDFLSIRSGKVKFYNKDRINSKLAKIGDGINLGAMNHQIFVDFFRYLTGTLFLHDKETNRQIEEVLSRYYVIYHKNMKPFPTNK